MNQEKIGVPTPKQEYTKEIEEGLSEYQENKDPQKESKIEMRDGIYPGTVEFRDGEGNVFRIFNTAHGTDLYRKGFEYWSVGEKSSESPTEHFKFKEWGESDEFVNAYINDDMPPEGKEAFVGEYDREVIFFPVEHWRAKLENSNYPPKIKKAIEKSIIAGIHNFKEKWEKHYPQDVFNEMLEKMEK